MTHVTVRLAVRRHHNDACLLSAVGQLSQQPPLPRRMAHSQVLPAPAELVKIQLHQTRLSVRRAPPADQYLLHGGQ